MALPRTPPLVPGTVGGPVSGGFNERFASPCPYTTLRVLGRPLAALKGMERENVRQDVREHLGISRSFTGKRVGAGCWAGGSVGVHMLLFFFSSPRVPYLAVARAFEKIEEVSAR